MKLTSPTGLKEANATIPLITPPEVYVMPPMLEVPMERLNVLVLTDGNNRAMGLNQDYSEGGKNVVKIAQYLARRGDVQKMLACIISKDNFQKRSADFFWKMYQAFLGLGVNILSNGVLVEDGIVIKVEGDLEALKRKNEIASLLADAIERVCKLTNLVKKPQMELVLGVNYDQTIACKHQVNLLFRSGMEESGAVRASGIQASPGMLSKGSTTLWPNVSNQEIGEIIDQAKNHFACHPKFLTEGYKITEALTLVRYLLSDSLMRAKVTIPLSENTKPLQSAFSKLANLDTTYQSLALEDRKMSLAMNIPPQPTQEEPIYDVAIAPGQTGQILLPLSPQLDYATIFECPQNNLEAICKKIRSAIEFSLKHVSLKGAERKMKSEPPPWEDDQRKSLDLLSINSVQRKQKIMSLTADFQNASEVVEASEQQQEKFLQAADFFVAEILSWVQEHGGTLTEKKHWLAGVNYSLTAFFMCFNPEREDWLTAAEWTAKYMQTVYHLDEAIFDKELEGETHAAKMLRLEGYASLYQDLFKGRRPKVKNGQPVAAEEHQILTEKVAIWRAFEKEFARTAHKQIWKLWQEEIYRFAGCSLNENRDASFQHPATRYLENDFQEQRVLRWAGQKISGMVESRLQKLFALARHENDFDLVKTEVNLWHYLYRIEASMGAGQTYLTICLGLPKARFNPENLKVIHDIAILSNCYYRILNDLSGKMKRNLDDRENKEDSLEIMKNYFALHESDYDASLQAITYLKDLADTIAQELQQLGEKIKDDLPELKIAMDRTVIAKDLYTEGHYRTLERSSVNQIIKKRFSVGFSKN